MPLSDQVGGSATDSIIDDPEGLLALDLAGVVGWCYGGRYDRHPMYGTWHLPHIGGEGARYCAFENTLAAEIARLKPKKLLLEAPLPLPAMNNRRSAFQQITLRGIAWSEAYRASIPIGEIDSTTVRMGTLGRLYSKDLIKREVVKFCRDLKWNPPDHNAADACLLWLWHRAQINGTLRVPGPMFGVERRAL